MSAQSGDGRTSGWSTGNAALTALVITALAFGALTRMSSIWLDEASSIALARLPFDHLWSILTQREANMSAYYVLINGWTQLGGDQAPLRLLSLLLAGASLAVLFMLGRLLFDRRTAFIAVVLMAVNGMFVAFETEVRGYMLALLMVVLSSYLFVRCALRPSKWSYVAYGIVGGASVYGHLFCFFVLAGHAASLPWLPEIRPRWRAFLLAYVVAGVIAAPMAIFTVTNGGQVGWIGDTSVRDLLATSVVVSGGLVAARARDSLHFGLGAALLGAYTLLIAVALRPLRQRSTREWPLVFSAAGLVAPVVLVAVVSVAVIPIFHYRYFVISLPFAVLLAARGLRQMPRRAALGAAALVLVASLVSAATCIGGCNREDWVGASEFVAAEAKSGDALFFYAPEVRTAFEYVYGDVASAGLPVAYPIDRWESLDYEQTTTPPDETLVAAAANRYRRIWLVLSHDDIEGDRTGARVRTWLSRVLGEPIERSYKSIRVFLYSSEGR